MPLAGQAPLGHGRKSSRARRETVARGTATDPEAGDLASASLQEPCTNPHPLSGAHSEHEHEPDYGSDRLDLDQDGNVDQEAVYVSGPESHSDQSDNSLVTVHTGREHHVRGDIGLARVGRRGGSGNVFSSRFAPQNVPPARAPAATSGQPSRKVALAAGTSVKHARRLQFAPQAERKRVRRKYLPPDYVPGDVYRQLDEYVAESRKAHLAERGAAKGSRRRSLTRSRSRGSILSSFSGGTSSHASSSSSSESSSSDSDSSSKSDSGSSSSSEGRYTLTLARIRAFFGPDSSDSSGSSTESSSRSSSSGEDSSTQSSSSTSSSRRSAGTSAAPSRSSRFRRRSRALNQSSSRPELSIGSGSDSSSHSGTSVYSRLRTLRQSISRSRPHPSQHITHRPHKHKYHSSRAPSQSLGHPNRHRHHRTHHHRRDASHRQEDAPGQQPLTERDLSRLPPELRPSRRARHAARLARQRAGGVTQYTMFTPVALPLPLPGQPHQLSLKPSTALSPGQTAGNMDKSGPRMVKGKDNLSMRPKQAPDNDLRWSAATNSVFATGNPAKVLETTSFLAVKQQLYALRAYRRQGEAAAADLGLGGGADRENGAAESVSFQPTVPDQDALEPYAFHDLPAPSDQFGEAGDLALPPPAIPFMSRQEVCACS